MTLRIGDIGRSSACRLIAEHADDLGSASRRLRHTCCDMMTRMQASVIFGTLRRRIIKCCLSLSTSASLSQAMNICPAISSTEWTRRQPAFKFPAGTRDAVVGVRPESENIPKRNCPSISDDSIRQSARCRIPLPDWPPARSRIQRHSITGIRLAPA